MTKNERLPVILVIDNDQSILDKVRYMLEHAGFSIETVSSSSMALIVFDELSPDAVLVDYNYSDIIIKKTFFSNPFYKHILSYRLHSLLQRKSREEEFRNSATKFQLMADNII